MRVMVVVRIDFLSILFRDVLFLVFQLVSSELVGLMHVCFCFFVELNMEFVVLVGLDGEVASAFDIWNMTWLLTRHLLGT